MMALQRVDRLKEPPIVGQFYLVPVVRGTWYTRRDAWPIMGPQHCDVEFFGFHSLHYHIDQRFLTSAQRRYGAVTGRDFQSAPLMQNELGVRPERMPKPILARRKCVQAEIIYLHGHRDPIPKIREHFAGRQCAGTKDNWICPHQKARLGSIAPVDGVIVCPLHGLKIDAETGVCLNAPFARNLK